MRWRRCNSNRVVPFTGREAELARLRQWLGEPCRIGAKLVYVPGGQGKTRLAAEFAAESVRAGWYVVVAHHAGDFEGTGKTDLVVAGNLDGVTPLLGRYDASYGLLLRGKGDGSFVAADMASSGLVIDGQVRHMVLGRGANGKRFIAIARNNDKLEILQVR